MIENLAKRRAVAIIRAQRMITPRPRLRKRLPRQAEPRAIARAYGKALAALVSKEKIRAAFAELLHELPSLLASARQSLDSTGHRDSDEGKRARALVALARDRLKSAVSTASIEELATQFANQTSTFQRIQLSKQVKAALGVDIFTADRGMQQRVSLFASENVSLIKGVTDDVSTRIEKAVTRAMTSGTLPSDLADQLDEQFGFGEDRAKMIARDQIGKLYGQINASRQQDLGVEKFTWRSSGDERVRDSHEELDGEEFTYDDPPSDEDGPTLPGEAILCRCSAEPVFDDILAETDGTEE